MSKTCENCGREVDDAVKFCPDCGLSSFKSSNQKRTAPNEEVTISYPEIDSSDSITPWIGKLFYWNENGKYYFSRTKFFSILIFLDIFIARIFYTSNVAVAFFVALIVAAISFFIGRSLHKRNDEHRVGQGLVKDVTDMLFYWDGSVISKTKIISISLYLILIVVYCINKGWSEFFVATMLFAVFALLAFFIGKSVFHNEG